MRKENREMLSPLPLFLTLPPLQGFSSRETDFYFHQFLSNFLKYSSSNFPSSHPYSIFAINFPNNFSLLKSFSSAISNFSCLLTSAFILPLNSSSASLAFSKAFLLSQVSCSAINPFHRTKYLSTSLIFLLFNISQSPTFWLLLSLLVFLLLFSVPPLVPCIVLSDWCSQLDGVTNFIQLVSPQPVDLFSQTKLHWKAPNEGYPHIWGMYKSDNKWLRHQTISSCKSFVCKYLMNGWTDSHSWTYIRKCSSICLQ